jgi:hypothetical protein
VKALGKPLEILVKLNEMVGFSPNEEIELYEASFLFMINNCPAFFVSSLWHHEEHCLSCSILMCRKLSLSQMLCVKS